MGIRGATNWNVHGSPTMDVQPSATEPLRMSRDVRALIETAEFEFERAGHTSTIHRNVSDAHMSERRSRLRVALVQAFEHMLRRNDLKSDDKVCLVFDSAGGAIEEAILIKHALDTFQWTDARIMLCDSFYDRTEAVPSLNHIVGNVEYFDNRSSMVGELNRLQDYRCVVNGIFWQSSYGVLTTFEESDNLKRVDSQALDDLLGLACRYGIRFSDVEAIDQGRCIVDYDELRRSNAGGSDAR